MESPSEKNSNIASSMTNVSAIESQEVAANTTSPTTIGIRTTAVATRFQVIETVFPCQSVKRWTSYDNGRVACEKTNLKEILLAGRLRRTRFTFVAFANTAVATVAILKIDKCLEQTRPVEVRPQCFGHKYFRIGDLPQKKIAHPHFAAGTDQQVRLRQASRIKVAFQVRFFQSFGVTSRSPFSEQCVCGVDDLRSPAIVQRNAQHHAGILRGRFHRFT